MNEHRSETRHTPDSDHAHEAEHGPETDHGPEPDHGTETEDTSDNDHAPDTEALEAMVDPAVVEMLRGPLSKLTKEAEILLFVAPGCPSCPLQVRTAAALTLASEKITVEVVNVAHEPELAAQYEVQSVPTTVVDDELIIVGVKHPVHMAEILLAREGPQGERTLFFSLMESGRIQDAADRILYGPDPETAGKAFLELWAKSTLQARMSLTLVAEEILTHNPFALNMLVPALISGLQDGGPLAEDPSRMGDTADLLGRIGDEDARPILEELSRDANPEIAEAAQDALEELD